MGVTIQLLARKKVDTMDFGTKANKMEEAYSTLDGMRGGETCSCIILYCQRNFDKEKNKLSLQGT